MVLAAVGAVKARVVLFDPLVPRTMELERNNFLNSLAPDPKSIELSVPGRRVVLIATLVRFERAVLAPPPPPPRQFPVSRQTVPVASGMVITLAAVPVPVSLKLLVAVPPMYKSRNGEELEPRSMVVEPGRREVFIATLVKFDRAVLAPPEPPPRQFPESVQTIPPASGSVIVLLAVAVPL